MVILKQAELDSLAKKASEIRKSILEMIHHSDSGHTGGSLSMVEIIVALYYHIMKHDANNPDWPRRDRFILSKGHCAPALYAVLADCGYFPIEDLKRLRQIGQHLQGHPNHRKTPGVEATTGSLGQGLSIALGMALGATLRGDKQYYYVLCGDGEMQEGQIWEAAMFGRKYKLYNVIAFVDRNYYQQNDHTEQIMPLEPLGPKWDSFGWNTYEIDGHDFQQILDAVERAKSQNDSASVIIAHTTKGKGVSFMENQPGWHGKSLNKEELERASKELGYGV
jgi:transketolase